MHPLAFMTTRFHRAIASRTGWRHRCLLKTAVPFVGGINVYRQGVHASGKFWRQYFIDHTVSLDGPGSGKGLTYRHHLEVALGAIGHIMTMAFIQHFQML
jgi:hypothetical protein